MSEQKENTPTPLKENQTNQTIDFIELKKNAHARMECLCATYDFLRRGYTCAQLRYEVQRFMEFSQSRNSAGKPIAYLDKFLMQWKIYADPNASPADGGQIADFLEAVQCDDLDTICNVESVKLKGENLCVLVKEREMLESVAAVIDKAVTEHADEYRLYMEDIGAKDFCYCAPEENRIKDGKCWIWERGEWRRVTREYAQENGFSVYPDTDDDQLDIYYKNHPNERAL